MKIVNNEKGINYKVGWEYHNPTLEKWLAYLGVTQSEVRAMKGEEKEKFNTRLLGVMTLVGAKCIPAPYSTDCIIYDEKGEELFRKSVKRQPCESWEDALLSPDGLERHDPEKARRYSLTKVLNFAFPAAEDDQVRTLNREIRTEVWKAYFDRNKTPVKQLVAAV